jgi:lipopolysaccharide transport system ATP-binding protein
MFDEHFWPSPDGFLDISGVKRVIDDRAHCTAVAMCNTYGQPSRVFRQGEAVHFFYEFEILESIEAVAGGLEFHNASNQIIHGKNSFQYDLAPQPAMPGTRLRYHHVIDLDVGPGEYWFTVGLASADVDAYQAYRDGSIGHEQFSKHIHEHCRMVDVGSFIVQYAANGKLMHHGIANLPSTCEVRVLPQVPSQAQALQQAPAAVTHEPTIIHVTHWKAGSQWIHRILCDLLPDRIVEPQVGETQFLNWPIQAGKIYPTVYVTKQQFDRAQLPPNSRHFVIVRDLRDTLVSAYFSMKISHAIVSPHLAQLRSTLVSLNMDDGLLYMLDEWLPHCANIQISWLEAGAELIRYEDLLDHDLDILEPLLLETCQLPISHVRLREVLLANRFASLTHGRERGQEDISVHERKGVAGDWQNRFTDRIKRAFKARYGGLLVATGYEQDLNW